jgi:hypothetical protein
MTAGSGDRPHGFAFEALFGNPNESPSRLEEFSPG